MKYTLTALALIGTLACGGAEQSEMAMMKRGAAADKTAQTSAASADKETAPTEANEASEVKEQKVVKTDAEWRALLSPLAYQVLRKSATERAFTGEYWNHKEDGEYLCGACGAVLFDSADKYRSGTGWPSYTQPAADKSLVKAVDPMAPWPGTFEVKCARCDSHLGHVFPDGPQPLGTRYCINSVALKFSPRAKESPSEEKGGE